jgi:hypothetical protein
MINSVWQLKMMALFSMKYKWKVFALLRWPCWPTDSDLTNNLTYTRPVLPDRVLAFATSYKSCSMSSTSSHLEQNCWIQIRLGTYSFTESEYLLSPVLSKSQNRYGTLSLDGNSFLNGFIQKRWPVSLLWIQFLQYRLLHLWSLRMIKLPQEPQFLFRSHNAFCPANISHGLLLMIFETCLTSEFLLQGTRSPLNAHDGLELQSLHVWSHVCHVTCTAFVANLAGVPLRHRAS